MPPKRRATVTDSQQLERFETLSRSVSLEPSTKHLRSVKTPATEVFAVLYGGFAWKIPVYKLTRMEIKTLLRYHCDTPRENEDENWDSVLERLNDSLEMHKSSLEYASGNFLAPGAEIATYLSFIRSPIEVD